MRGTSLRQSTIYRVASCALALAVIVLLMTMDGRQPRIEVTSFDVTGSGNYTMTYQLKGETAGYDDFLVMQEISEGMYYYLSHQPGRASYLDQVQMDRGEFVDGVLNSRVVYFLATRQAALGILDRVQASLAQGDDFAQVTELPDGAVILPMRAANLPA